MILILMNNFIQNLQIRQLLLNTGAIITPIRRLLRCMEDVAIIVCKQCITDNGLNKDDPGYEVILIYRPNLDRKPFM